MAEHKGESSLSGSTGQSRDGGKAQDILAAGPHVTASTKCPCRCPEVHQALAQLLSPLWSWASRGAPPRDLPEKPDPLCCPPRGTGPGQVEITVQACLWYVLKMFALKKTKCLKLFGLPFLFKSLAAPLLLKAPL